MANKNRLYSVTLPITGTVTVEVEAKTEAEAIEKALEQGASDADIQEWNVHEYVCQGNVFYGTLNDAYADDQGPVEEDDEDEDGD